METASSRASFGGTVVRHASAWARHGEAIGPVRLDAEGTVVALAYRCVDGTHAWIVRASGRVVADGGYVDAPSAMEAADAALVERGYVALDERVG